MKKFLILTVLLILIASGAIIFAWSYKESFILKKIQGGLSALTGTEVVIKDIQVKKAEGLLCRLSMSEIEVRNPAGFTLPQMALLTDVELVISPLALLNGNWRVDHAFAHLQIVNISYGADQKFNLENIQALHPREENVFKNFLIKRLELKMGQMNYLDFRVQPPLEESFDFDGKTEVYDYVVSPEILIQVPALKFMEKANKGSLGLARGKIQESITQNTGKQAE